MKKFAALMIVAVLMLGCNNALYVQNVKTISNNDKTLFYYVLPKTVLVVQVPVKVTKKEPSKYQGKFNSRKAYLEELNKHLFVMDHQLNPDSNTISYSIKADGILVNPAAVPDETKMYKVAYACLPFKKIESSFGLTKNGMITNGSFAQSDIALEAGIKLGEYVAGKATDFIIKDVEDGAAGEVGATGSENLKSDKDKTEKMGEGGKKDKTDGKKAIAPKITTEIKELCEQYVFLKELKDKLYVASGSKSLDVLKYQEKSIVAELKGIAALLLGKTTSSTQWYIHHYDPSKDGYDKDLWMVKEFENGLKLPDGSTYGEVDDNELKNIWCLVPHQSENNIVNEKLIESSPGSNDGLDTTNKYGFVYNIPAQLRVAIKLKRINDNEDTTTNYVAFKNSPDDKQTLPSQTIYFAQLGTTGTLPRKMSKIDFKFYSDLGALKSLSFSRDIYLTDDRMGSVLGAVDSARTVYQMYREAREEEEEEDVALPLAR